MPKSSSRKSKTSRNKKVNLVESLLVNARNYYLIK